MSPCLPDKQPPQLNDHNDGSRNTDAESVEPDRATAAAIVTGHVWIYGLQLAAYVTFAGFLLLAVVSLCRQET